MNRLTTLLATTAVMLCAAPYGRTESAPGAANTDQLDGARTAEVKGDLARIRNENGQAIADYLAAIRMDRQNSALYNKLGIAELQLGERSAARKSFGLAIKYDPQLTPALNNLGATALLDKRYKVAVLYFKKALAMDELSAPTHVNLAEAWVGLGDTDRAMTEYARALELDADVLTSDENGTVALIRTPEQRARIDYLIAKSYMKRGNTEGALEYLGRAKELHYPDLAKVYTDADFTPLWNDPRLAKIAKR